MNTVGLLEDLCDGDTFATWTKTWTGTVKDGHYATYFQFFHPQLNAMRCTCDAFKFTPAMRCYPGELKTEEGMYNLVFLGNGKIQHGCKHIDAAWQIAGITEAFWEAYLNNNWYEAREEVA